MTIDDRTIDPQSIQSSQLLQPRKQPTITVLFHPDLSRIGDVCRTDELGTGGWMSVGRNEPMFGDTGLGDPCVSRKQFSLRWNRIADHFELQVEPGARREVVATLPDGAVVGPTAMPPGTIIRVGDRMLLMVSSDGGAAAVQNTGTLVGQTVIMSSLRERIRAVARAMETVLVVGETGVGKELVAHAIHDQSARSNGPFVSLNCAALAPQVIESELFGHRRGAFTGANEASTGLFRAAEGGTLFLDEIGELAAESQAKFLRALQEKKVRPVGATSEISVNVRVVAATNRDLEAEVQAGRFREDLYARLIGLVVQAPTLRERRADAALLFTHFLEARRLPDRPALSRLWQPASDAPPPIPMEFYQDLIAYGWPRNVREVEKLAVEVAAINDDPAATGFVAPNWPSSGAIGDATETLPPSAVGEPSIDYRPPSDLDEATIMATLEEHGFVQKRAAKALGISRTSLDKLLQEMGVSRPNDLTADEIKAARKSAAGDVAETAKILRVSLRGLKLRMTALEMDD